MPKHGESTRVRAHISATNIRISFSADVDMEWCGHGRVDLGTQCAFGIQGIEQSSQTPI